MSNLNLSWQADKAKRGRENVKAKNGKEETPYSAARTLKLDTMIECEKCGTMVSSRDMKSKHRQKCIVNGKKDEVTVIRITAPHFVAGIDLGNNVYAPIVKYMRGWTLKRIEKYCQRKNWQMDIVL